MDSTSWHEASHAVAAAELGLPVTAVSIRPAEDSAGRTHFDINSEGFRKLDDLSCAVIKCACEVGARIAAGARRPEFNWLADHGDAVDARSFVARAGGDELDTRRLVALKAYAVLSVRWAAVEELAAKFQRSKTILGEEVEEIVRKVRLRNNGWTDEEIRAGRHPISKPAAVAKMTPAGRKAITGTLAPDGKRIEKRSTLTADPRLAEIDRQIAELATQIAPLSGADPETFPLFKKMSLLYRKRRELVAQLEGAK